VNDLFMQHSLLASKDLGVIQDRVRKEGDSFLTITLPSLGAALEAALERGFLSRSDVTSFGHDRRSALPKFLKGLWRKIFSNDGVLLSEPDSDAIFAIRQIAYLQKKPKGLCSEKRNRKAIARFRAIEEELASYEEIASKDDPILRKVSDLIWRPMFCNIKPSDIVCRHGPGATAERKSANSRFTLTHWNDRSQECFPLDLHGVFNYGHYKELENISLLALGDELPVRVVQVPKTKKTPRTIAIEPSHVQYTQQGLMLLVTKHLESHPLTKHSVRFADQSVNSECARRASVDRRRATLDLSDASDRVSLSLVKNIFKNSALLPYLLASRSGYAQLPDSELPLCLRKFASMGSAMCFPVEAMVFYTLILVALHYYHNEVPSYSSIRRFSRSVEVYGDDLIVPTYSRRIVQTCLQAYGLKVNESKSFSEGYFRESCGGDFYQGYDVTPVYLREPLPARLDHSNLEVLVSLVETSNHFYEKGLWSTCQKLRDFITTRIPRTWSISRSRVVTGYLSFTSKFITEFSGFSFMLNAKVTRGLQLYPILKPDECLTPSGILLKALGQTPSSPWPADNYLHNVHVACMKVMAGSKSFDTSVKRGVFKAKRRWFSTEIGAVVV